MAGAHNIRGLVVAAPASGAGKTTITLGLMAAFARRGLAVAPFKVGPDFIDPGHHSRITGAVSRNLDGWMLPRETCRRVFSRGARGRDVAVVEGVMGLFDGYDGASEAGSTAQMAKWCGLPVLLVVGARGMARSIAAVARGFAEFDPECRVCAVVANNVGGARHTEYLREALEAAGGPPLIGGVPRDEAVAIPERHLGLVTTEDHGLGGQEADALAGLVEEHLDLDRLLEILPETPLAPEPAPPAPVRPDLRVGVARDRAFCFYYEDNLDVLREAGCETVFFSPLSDAGLPEGLDGLYFGGGYPELHAVRLAGNRSMRDAVLAASRAGMPVYGECGGYMYLGRSLADLDGETHPMCGVFAHETRMQPRLAALGYREVRLTADTPIGPAGAVVRGHEFHYSRLEHAAPGATNAYEAADRAGAGRDCPGWLAGNTLGSYVHLHFGHRPETGADFARACRRYRAERM